MVNLQFSLIKPGLKIKVYHTFATVFRLMFYLLDQCRVYFSVSVYRNFLVYFDPQWELVQFLFDTVSMVVMDKAVQKLGIGLSNFYLKLKLYYT